MEFPGDIGLIFLRSQWISQGVENPHSLLENVPPDSKVFTVTNKIEFHVLLASKISANSALTKDTRS